MIINKKENWYEELFDVFADHGLTLTQTEIGDIMHKVHEVSEQSPERVSVDAMVSVLTHDEFELDKAAQISVKEYGGAGSFKDGGLWMLDWLRKKVKKEFIKP